MASKLKGKKAALRNLQTKAAREIVEGTKLKQSGSLGGPKSEVKKTRIQKRKDNSANLGKYLYKSKLPNAGTKIGASNVKVTTKAKLLKTRAQKGAHLNV